MIDRIGRLVAVVAVVLVLAFGWWADQQASDADDRAASEEIAREALAAQVEQLGAEPVVPPGEDTEPGDVIVVPGEPGPQGVQGPPGSPGRNGEDGSACVPTNPACVGPTGPQGAAGAAGESGIGTQGEPGPTGPQGEPGPQGPQGEPGTSFTSFTFTDGPRTFRCTDPDGDHEFMCEQIEPPPVVTLP